jgi:ArsR family transcriptional regulator
METVVCATIRLDEEALSRGVARFKALADRTRLGILLLIAGKAEPICVCEINEFFDLEQPTISHHL